MALGSFWKKSATDGAVGSVGGLGVPDGIGSSPSYITPKAIKVFIALFGRWLAHSNFSMVSPGYMTPSLFSFSM